MRDAWSAISDDLYVDLVAILTGWQAEGKKPFKHMPPKVQGADHLFLYLDDYESMQGEFGKHFLVRNFVPKLLSAPFHTLVLISGRDDLSATHPDWSRIFPSDLRGHTLRLKPIRAEDIQELLRARGIGGNLSSLAEQVFGATEGYPLLVEMMMDEMGGEGLTAVGLMKFYDRQTQWMTREQKRWLDFLSFLDRVNVETIPKVLPKEDPEVVFDWFQREGSIRDTAATTFTVRPFVRTRVLEYFKLKWPTRFREIQASLGR